MSSMTSVSFLLAVAMFGAAGLSAFLIRKSHRDQKHAEAKQERLLDEIWELKSAASALDKAEAASEAKTRFLATVSHEFRQAGAPASLPRVSGPDGIYE